MTKVADRGVLFGTTLDAPSVVKAIGRQSVYDPVVNAAIRNYHR